MTRDPRRYSTIRKEPAHKPADGYSMHAFYDSLTKPPAIVLTLVGYFAAINQDLWSYIDGAAQGDRRSVAHLLVLLLSLLAGFRVIQSLYLAKRDYAHLENGSFDILIFMAVGAFASGAALKFLRSNLKAVLLIYAACSLIGAINFFRLYNGRIPADSDNYDYPIERRIQAVNTLVFAGLVLLLTLAALAAHRGSYLALYWMVGASCALIIVNIIHSEQLTMLPKFLFHNEPDSPSNSIKTFREIFGPVVALKSDEEIAGSIYKHGTDFQPIKTIRATRKDSERICAELLQNFSYVFQYILDTNDKAKLKRLLRNLITCAGGFGGLGYMSFYFITNEEGEQVGLFKIDTAHNNLLYQILGLITLPFIVVVSLRTTSLIKIWRRAQHVLSDQASSPKKELRLCYIIIYHRHRKRGYGESFLRLLHNACCNNTNDILADRITLLVREKNLAARRLFEKTGFSPMKAGLTYDSDPFVRVKSIGRPIIMERRLS